MPFKKKRQRQNKQMTKRDAFLICGIFLLLGTVFDSFALWKYFETRSFVEQANRSDGVIISMEKVTSVSSSKNGGTSISYKPYFEYNTPGGVRQARATTSTNPPMYKVGDKISVLYSPTNPEDGRIESFCELWLLQLIFGTIGSIMLLVALLIFIVANRTGSMQTVREI